MTIEDIRIIPATRQNSGDMPSFSDTVFGFLDENYPSSENSSLDTWDEREWGDEEEDDEHSYAYYEDNKAFWDEQEKLLNGILYRTSSIESNVRHATKEGLRKLIGTINCECRRSDISGGCRDCLMLGMLDHLCQAGFVCFVQKSKWKSCRDIPSGEHSYLEVIEKASGKREETRIVIELNFREEFEMGKASQEYNKLIRKLPQVYVGKQEKLRKMVKILCGCAKKCMKDNRMHLAPWRNHKHMQSKWLPTSNPFISTKTPVKSSISINSPDRRWTSLLTRTLIQGVS